MVESGFTVCVFCICSAVLAVFLRQYCREQSVLLTLLACSAVTGASLLFIAPMLEDMRELFYEAGVNEGYIDLIFKASALSIITSMTTQICRDCGELTLAQSAELWGRGALTFMTLPLLKALVSTIGRML